MNNALKILSIYLFLAGVTGEAGAQSDDYEDGNDDGWTQFHPLAAAAVPSPFSFPGGAYQLAVGPSPSVGVAGPSRASAFRLDQTYARFCVMVDVLDFTAGEETSITLLARVQPNPAAGAVNGLALSYQTKDKDFEINRITNEAPARRSLRVPVTLDPGRDYRFVFSGNGGVLFGRIYDLANLAIPVVEVVGSDASLISGGTGIAVFSDENARAYAQFDNFFANDGSPPPLRASITASGQHFLTWAGTTGLCAALESSSDLSAWLPVTQAPSFAEGLLRVTVPAVRESRFYRLRAR